MHGQWVQGGVGRGSKVLTLSVKMVQLERFTGGEIFFDAPAPMMVGGEAAGSQGAGSELGWPRRVWKELEILLLWPARHRPERRRLAASFKASELKPATSLNGTDAVPLPLPRCQSARLPCPGHSRIRFS